MLVKPSKMCVCKYCEKALPKEYEDLGVCARCLDTENDFLDDEEPTPFAGMWDLKQEDYY